MAQNSFPLKEWHYEHTKKMITKYLIGLSDDSTNWEKKHGKRLTSLPFVCKQIEYDMKHGISLDEVTSVIRAIKIDSEFLHIRRLEGSLDRLAALEAYFIALKRRSEKESVLLRVPV